MAAKVELKKNKIDFILLLLVLMLIGVGLVMVYSASSIIAYDKKYAFDMAYFFKKQVKWVFLGLFVMVVVMNIPFRAYRKLIFLILPILLLSLFYVLFFGDVRNNARSWIDLGFMSIQPSEFAKLGLIIYLAHIYTKKAEKISDFKRGVLPPLAVVFIFFSLIAVQPDLGIGMVIVILTGFIIFVSGARIKHLITLSVFSFTAFYILTRFKSYWMERLTSFFNPWDDTMDSDYQLVNSLIAIGTGGMKGNGLGNSIQKYYYLPEAHTDFIFAIYSEEFGFIGVLFFILLFGLFIFRGLYIANRCPDEFGTLLGFGIIFMIGIQACINILITVAAFPITGITLPFISYGGSSMLSILISVGILLNISRYAKET